MNEENKCPVTGGSNKPNPGRAASIQDWWPKQLNLQILHQHSALSNPMSKTFNYAT